LNNRISLEQTEQFAAAWYRALDVHAPLSECLGMLAETDLSMRFPDGEINDALSFQKWYERVRNLFFDEKHTVLNVEILGGTDEQADLTVTVRWQSSWWEPPAAESNRVDLESAQKWTVRRCATTRNTFGLEIVTYILVDELKYAPGSAQLPAGAPDEETALDALNRRFAEMEQQGGREAIEFFGSHLSHELIFRRANGKVVGKFGREGFLEGLSSNPFRSRAVEDVSVTQQGDHALVTLIIVGTRKDDQSIHRYRNIRLLSRSHDKWIVEFWFNYEIPGL
jgi:hypothetical protein